MRRLILLRHAKSSWDDPGLDDHARPLAGRGIHAAPAMASWMLDEGWIPDRVLCSDAVRTRQTWALVSEVWEDELPTPPPVRFRPTLYHSSAGRILRVVAEEDDGIETLMVVGHNPGMHDLAMALTAPGPSKAHRRLASKFPTAAVAVLEADVRSWSHLSPGSARLVAFRRPRDLSGRGGEDG